MKKSAKLLRQFNSLTLPSIWRALRQDGCCSLRAFVFVSSPPTRACALRYATARIDNLCEDWAGDYYPIAGQDPHRIYVQPFCTTEYHPKPHAHGIYSGPYSLRRRCMAGQGAHRLVAVFVFVVIAVQVMFGRFLTGDVDFGRQKRAVKG